MIYLTNKIYSPITIIYVLDSKKTISTTYKVDMLMLKSRFRKCNEIQDCINTVVVQSA